MKKLAIVTALLAFLASPAFARDEITAKYQTEVVNMFLNDFMDFSRMTTSWTPARTSEDCTTKMIYTFSELDPNAPIAALNNDMKVFLIMCAVEKGYPPRTDADKSAAIHEMIKHSKWAAYSK